MQKTFFISTAIDYPSSRFHLGHAYEKIVTDTIARWKRLEGYEVYFSTGTDCHGLKIQRAAEKTGKEPSVFVEEISDLFRELCKVLNISYDDFIMTTEKRHEKTVDEILKALYEKGDIYEGEYEGNYCVDCETFYMEKDLVEGKCPVHKKEAERVKEKSYFFRMSKYQKKLVEDLQNNPDSLWPEKKRNEILNRLKEPLKDLTITREKVKWGIPLPFDKGLTVAIWVDALINYLSTVEYPNQKFKKFWPATHVVGSDIVWHHEVIWKTMLLALGIKLPNIIVHGFINTEFGEKMSKSKGTVIDPIALADSYTVDALRYFLLREIPFGQDGNFSEEALKERLNNELANGLGNLVNRTIVMIEKYCKGTVPMGTIDKELQKKLNLEKIEKHMKELELHHALAEIFSFVTACNQFINEKQPWKQEEKERNGTLYSLADSLRIISILLQPFMPETSEKINAQIGVKAGSLKECRFNLLKAGTKVKKGEILFKKAE
ncbi:MAG: methionine--tRNA ligase [archaeon]